MVSKCTLRSVKSIWSNDLSFHLLSIIFKNTLKIFFLIFFIFFTLKKFQNVDLWFCSLSLQLMAANM